MELLEKVVFFVFVFDEIFFQGFAYIDFDNEDGLLAALKLNNHKVKGSKLKVRRSDPANKGAARHGSRNEGIYGGFTFKLTVEY